MKNYFSLLLFIFFWSQASCQEVQLEGRCQNPKFEKTVINYLDFSVPVISVEKMALSADQYLIMDAREIEEYDISHIPKAIHVGYDDFDIKKYEKFDKDQSIIVYCSIGYRSEKIAEKLTEAGFKNVYNLFGSIFEWVNQGHGVIDSRGLSTKQIHTYNKKWGKWMENQNFKKVN